MRFFALSLCVVMAAVTTFLITMPLSVSAQGSCPSGLPVSVSSTKQKTLSRPLLDPPADQRKYRIYTPTGYNRSQPSKIALVFHGWGQSGSSYMSRAWKSFADIHNYVMVAPDGLKDGAGSYNSWTFPGSDDGIGQLGTITTCDNTQGPDYCYNSCAPCPSRCGWTHCLDDDFQFVVDLINDLRKYVCVDPARVYAVGISNGGMFAWSLGQDSRTAPLLAGLGPIIGLPHHDYNIGGNIPVIGIYGSTDCTVPPGDGSQEYATTCDGEYYNYVDARFLHHKWAQEQGCLVTAGVPAFVYNIAGRPEITCRTHCNPADGPPESVDCRAAMGHSSPAWTFDAVLKFFDAHNP